MDCRESPSRTATRGGGTSGRFLVARVLIVGITASLIAACSAPAGFSAANARRHITTLAQTFGSRPLGTDANARARAYLVDELEQLGFDVRIQEADVVRREQGQTSHVFNIIAAMAGEVPDAIGLVAHYDSVPDGPGAADDAFGTAIVMEAARVLAARPRARYSVMVLLTDGEESGLVGASALVDDPTVTGRLRGYVNVESIGADGPAFLFETGPENGALLRAWARATPAPRGASFALEIYARLPRDTDFSILKQAGIPGLNLALVGESGIYHTARDTADHIPDRALQETGDNVVAIMGALDQTDLAEIPPNQERYFDVAGLTGISYGNFTGRIMLVLALILGGLGWWRTVMPTMMVAGLRRTLLTLLWIVVGVIAIAGAMTGAVWLLRASREVYHPWYAVPDRLLFLLLATGALVGLALAGLGGRTRWRGCAHPAVIWCVVLPVWIGLAAAMEWLAPAASFLWTVPLLASGAALVAFAGWHPRAFGVASIVALVVTGTVWLRDTYLMFHFLVAVLGRQPIVTPVWIYPAFLLSAGLMVVPPFVLVASVVGYERRLFLCPTLARVVMLAFGVAAWLAYVAPAYSEGQPLRRYVRYVQHETAGRAVWEVGSNEPSLGVTADGQRLPWQAVDSSLVAGGDGRRFDHPFIFRALAPSTAPLPASVAATLEPRGDRVNLKIVVRPDMAGTTVSFVMPEGTLPFSASLPGVARRGSGWIATYRPVPTDGFTFTATFSDIAELSIRQGTVILQTFRLPGGAGPQHLPPWLQQDRSVWSASATFILPIASLLDETAGTGAPRGTGDAGGTGAQGAPIPPHD